MIASEGSTVSALICLFLPQHDIDRVIPCQTNEYFAMTSSDLHKFGRFVDIYCTIQHAHFQLCKWSGFRDMALRNAGKRSFSPPRQHIETIRCLPTTIDLEPLFTFVHNI